MSIAGPETDIPSGFVERAPGRMGGDPVIRGTRITTFHVAELARQGASLDEFRADYGLRPEQVEAAIAHERDHPTAQSSWPPAGVRIADAPADR